jgi:hypothetical protein
MATRLRARVLVTRTAFVSGLTAFPRSTAETWTVVEL